MIVLKSLWPAWCIHIVKCCIGSKEIATHCRLFGSEESSMNGKTREELCQCPGLSYWQIFLQAVRSAGPVLDWTLFVPFYQMPEPGQSFPCRPASVWICKSLCTHFIISFGETHVGIFASSQRVRLWILCPLWGWEQWSMAFCKGDQQTPPWSSLTPFLGSGFIAGFHPLTRFRLLPHSRNVLKFHICERPSLPISFCCSSVAFCTPTLSFCGLVGWWGGSLSCHLVHNTLAQPQSGVFKSGISSWKIDSSLNLFPLLSGMCLETRIDSR